MGYKILACRTGGVRGFRPAQEIDFTESKSRAGKMVKAYRKKYPHLFVFMTTVGTKTNPNIEPKVMSLNMEPGWPV